MSKHPPTTTGPGRPYREVTFAAIIFAIVIGLVMNASITYAGLKIGFTIGGSAIAAVLGFGVLRGMLRVVKRDAGSVLETNIAQTIASSVNTSNSGVIFTVPVLFLIGITLTWNDLDFWLITLACVAGAILGTAFIIPLRKQMIDIERLRFPSATGVATILKSPGAGVKKTLVLLAGILLSALIYAPAGLPAIKRPVDHTLFVSLEQRSFAELVEAARADPGLEGWDALDRLVYQERIPVSSAELTREIEGWIRQGSVPETLVARGQLLQEWRTLRTKLGEAREQLKQRPVPPAARAEVAQLNDEIARLDELLASPEYQTERPYSDELAIACYRTTLPSTSKDPGPLALTDLRQTVLGWAGKPLFGYQDVQWRLRSRPDENDPAKLHPDVDRAENGRADLVLTDNMFNLGRLIGLPGQFELIFAIAPFALGAGFITGRAGLMVLAGGILAYFILNPVSYSMGWLPGDLKAHEAPEAAFKLFNRPLGIGLLLGGAMMGILASFPAITAALKSVARAGRTSVGKVGRDELGIRPLLIAVLGALVLLFAAADFVGNKPLNEGGMCPVTGSEVTYEADPATYKGYAIAFATQEAADTWSTAWTDEQRDEFLRSKNARPGWLSGIDPHLRAAVIAVIGALWIWFAGIIIAQCTGMTDWSPISGIALLTVVLVLLLAGTGAVLGAVLIGAALCVAITLAADMMADLRTGHLVGSIPRKQQIVELCVVGIGPVIAMLTVLLIVEVNLKSYGVPIGPGTETSAPQAQALEAVITGVQGGDMPYMLFGLGAILGGLLGLGSFAGLGVLVGLSVYLPFFYIATYGIGCVANMVIAKVKGRAWAEEWGVPFCAGLIVGESVLQLCINCVVLILG